MHTLSPLERARQLKLSQLEELARHRDELRKHPRLRYLFLELTDSCNLSCLHCGSNCKPTNAQFLDLSLVKPILQEIAAQYHAPSIMLCITGGEPLLHPDLLPLMKYASALGFSWGMTTNGTLIDSSMAAALAEAGMRTVTVSIDGLEETNDWFRRKKGAFEQAMHGIDCLIAQDFAVQVTTVVHQKNLHLLDALYEVLRVHHVQSWRIVNIEPIGRANQHPELLLSRAEIMDVLGYIKAKRFDTQACMEVTYGCAHFLPVDLERMVRDFYFMCAAGVMVASIRANGDIVACLDIESRPDLIQGNIHTDSFCHVWKNAFQIFRRDRTSLSEQCSQCVLRVLCGGDSFHTWDFDHQKPRLCFLHRSKDK